jgi:CubicO group peptidase (beta-lactamase class C family)
VPASFEPAAAILRDAVAARAFPAAAIEVGTRDGPLWREAFGALRYDDEAPRATPETVFDLASLTKVITTTTLVMREVRAARLDLDEPVAGRVSEWRSADRVDVTIRDLLAHCAGLTAWLPLFRDHVGRRDYQHAIATLPLEYVPRSRSLYSDLGFILLGFILEDIARQPLVDQGAALIAELGLGRMAFNPPASWRDDTAPTEVDAWRGRLLAGEVHDENCWALGGAAGHAGLFGTVASVGTFARLVLRAWHGDEAGSFDRATLHAFVEKRAVPGGSRALGWDTMLPTSSCGTRMSAAAFGHTGFTGTSLWIDPRREVYVVLLTNRVHPDRHNERIRAVRPRLHDVIVGELLE